VASISEPIGLSAIIALAQRKHPKVRSELLHIINTDQRNFLRVKALFSLKEIVKEEDRPVLKQIAQTDVYKREDHHMPQPDGSPTIRYPVRDAARRVLEYLEAKK
jgi:hypothetical protein